MKKIIVCIAAWSLCACQTSHHEQPRVASDSLSKAASTGESGTGAGPAPQLKLKHYLELTGEGEVLLAAEQARLNQPISLAQGEADERLSNAFDPATFRLSLANDGRYQVSVEYKQVNHATNLLISAEGNALTGAFTATVSQLGLEIDFVCLKQRFSGDACDPIDNALVTFKGMQDFTPFEGARFSFLYQSTAMAGRLVGNFKTDYLGHAQDFTSDVHGQLLVIDILNPFTINAEQIRLDVISSHGTMIFAAKDEPTKSASAPKIRWGLDKSRSTDPYQDTFKISNEVTASSTGHFVLPLDYPFHVLQIGNREAARVEFTLDRPLL